MNEATSVPVSALPMSVGQRALWFEQLAQPSSNAYNLAVCLRFPQAVDRIALQTALQGLSRRHPLLRARFAISDQEPLYTISPVELSLRELGPVQANPDVALMYCEEFLLHPYDLAAEDPFRVGIIDVAGGGTLLAIGAHHIVMDLHSAILVVTELASLYSSPDTSADHVAERVSYAEFCNWQKSMLASDEGKASAEFWQRALDGFTCEPGFLESAGPTFAPSNDAGRLTFAISRDDRDAIEHAAAASSTTPFVLILTAMQALIAARNNDRLALIGTPSSGRNDRRFRQTVGYFVNLLPMQLAIDRRETFSTTLTRNGKRVRDALKHGQYPLASMIEQSRAMRGAAPRLQATLTFQKSVLGLTASLAHVALQLPGGGISLGSQFGDLIPLRATRAQFPLGIAVAAVDNGYLGCLEFDRSQVTQAMAEAFCADWLAIVRSAACDSGRSLASLLDGAMANAIERADLASTLEDAFAAHADRPAVANATETWSYRQLSARSGAVAKQLRTAEVQHGQRVAVIGDGDLTTVCAMVGVLRAGAAYVPIDADVDPDRVRMLVETAHVEAVLDCTPTMRFERSLSPFQVLAPSTSEAEPVTGRRACHSLDPAWVMFTSGTTGRPKAAIVPHEAALAHAHGIAARFALNHHDRVLQFASLSFDEHAEEIFPTLLAGACVLCAPRVRMNDPETLLRLAAQSGVTVLHLPTSYWHVWMDEAAHATLPGVPSLRLVNAGGEQASVARLRIWSQVMPPSVRWVNSYGLTEAAVTSLLWEFDRNTNLQQSTRIPAGTPLPGCHLRIVSDDMNDVAPGETGELLLGGVGVGLGYLGQSSRPATPFFSVDGVRWLRTGDLAYLDSTGNVVLAGRRDRVRKIRGGRVDPSELEATIAKHPAVLECVVTFAEDAVVSEVNELELHVAVRDGDALGESALHAYWQRVLPNIPLPTAIIFHRTIPRTAGLKPDFTRLRRVRYTAPTPPNPEDQLARTVTAIFTRLLQRPVAGDANFFSLGGHSLLAMRLVAALRRELHVELPIANFLANPTLQAVIAHCRSNAVMCVANILPEDARPSYPLSRAQRRALLMTTTIEAASAELAIAVVQLEGNIERAQLQSAWRNIVKRHRLLTARIDDAGNTETAIDGTLHDLGMHSSLPRKRSRLARAAREAFLRAMDPGAVLACALLETPHSVLLVIGARHTAADGASLSSLVGEMARHCDPSQGILPPAPSYRRFVAAENEWLASPAHAAARAYWEERLAGDPGPTRLTGMKRDARTDYRSRRIGLTLNSTLQNQVLALAHDVRSTPFAVLLASFIALLARFSASEDVLIGVPVSLRELFGLPDVVGPTLNPLPFRMRVRQEDNFADLVRDVHARLAEALQHSALPVEEMTARAPSLRGAPLPIQLVAQQRTLSSTAHGPIFRVLSERDGLSPATLLAAAHLAPQIRLELEYRTALVDDASATRLLDAWRTLLRGLVTDPTRAQRETRMVSRRYIERTAAIVDSRAAGTVDRCLHDGLCRNARLHPDRIALVGSDRQITYGDLEVITDRHAAQLIAAGVERGDRVVIASRNGLEECIAAVAILKAGAVYVPLAWDLPPARANTMVMRVGARVMTGAPGLDQLARATDTTFIAVDLDPHPHPEPPAQRADANLSAYILFTSGSTGEPKGVEMTHAAAMVTVHEILRRFDIGDRDVFYAHAALGFDLSVFDLFGAWAAGGCVVLPSAAARFDAFSWTRDVSRYSVSVWNSVPSALDMLLDAAPPEALRSLRRLLVSGDRIGLDLPGRAARACPDATFVALGGATEAGIWSNCQVVDRVDPAWGSIPYGRALGGQSMFVVEPGGWPAPPGVPGEICIGGGALAQGYFADDALTAAKFTWHAQSGQRVYRTGDQGRYFADGSIEFLGRLDRQLKLRGYRIEAGDVEVAIATFFAVRRALVQLIDKDELVAYVVPDASATIDPEALHRHAERHLPEHMRPSRYVVIEQVPLTANGKIDWNALADQSRTTPTRTAELALPLSPTERRIAALWEELLPGRAPRRNDDFFSTGGHSLLAVRLIARIQREFGFELPLARWLPEPTLAQLARIVEMRGPLDVQPTRSNADLRMHVRLADDLVFAPPRTRPGAIVITGASGLIGTRLLAACLQEGSNEIVCLLRDTPEHRAESAILQYLDEHGIAASSVHNRIRWMHGDLALPRFGLSANVFAELASATGTVFHVGAAVNLIAPYEVLSKVNVDGTQEAIRLAAMAGATLHHVSSIGVLPYGKGRVVTETDSIDVAGTLLTGYCQTKWVAEQIVRCAAARGLRTAIYRPGLTLSERRTSGDLLDMLASLVTQVGALPDLELPIDLVAADYVAAAILKISTDERCIGGTFHLTHPHPVMLAAAIQPLRLAGMTIPLVPFAQWQAKLQAAIPDIGDPRIAAIAALVASQDEAELTPAKVDCSRCRTLLQGTDTKCASVLGLLAPRLQQLSHATREAPQ